MLFELDFSIDVQENHFQDKSWTPKMSKINLGRRTKSRNQFMIKLLILQKR
jgi:hypothetical protein